MNYEGQKIYRDKETSFPDDNNTYKEDTELSEKMWAQIEIFINVCPHSYLWYIMK